MLENQLPAVLPTLREKWQFLDIKQKIIHIDKNSMHPSSAVF